MKAINDYSDERNKGSCVHCGCALLDEESNGDHVPSRTLLLDPYPENLSLISVCSTCNQSFSLDEEYLSVFLSVVLSGSVEPNKQVNPEARRALLHSSALRERLEKSRRAVIDDEGVTGLAWEPEIERVTQVLVKNARGHALYELGEPMLDAPSDVWFAPLFMLDDKEREAFEGVDNGSLYPEVGSRLLSRVVMGHDLSNGWIIVQPNVYRFAVQYLGGTEIRMVLHEYLAARVSWDV